MCGPLSESVVVELLGQPNRRMSRGHELRYGRYGSLAVNVERGVWCDHEAGQSGGAVDLVQRVQGGSRADAAAWLEARGLKLTMGEGRAALLQGNASKLASCPLPLKPAPAATKISEASEGNACALALWHASQPPEGTAVERYLEGRGLSLPAEPVRVLRFHPACPFGSARFPAMLALIRNAATGLPQGVHRTALTLEGKRACGRDGVNVSKMMLGTAGRGAVMLSDGKGFESGLAIAEGVETALAAFQRAPWLPTWAALSAGGIAAFPVLVGIRRLVIYADNDLKPDGRNPGLDAARTCASRWAQAGRWWSIEHPEQAGRDFADLLKEQAT